MSVLFERHALHLLSTFVMMIEKIFYEHSIKHLHLFDEARKFKSRVLVHCSHGQR